MVQLISKKFYVAAAVFASMLAVTAPTQAVVYSGAWDPAFGSAFPQLGWRGEAKFFVPDACVIESGWVTVLGCSGMKILGAEVEFYKLSDPTNTQFQETLSFDIPSIFNLAVKYDDGELTKVLGGFPYFRESTLSIAGGPYTKFWLSFLGDLASMFYVSDPPYGKTTWGFSDPNPPGGGGPFITFRQVPEPGSLFIVLAALGALGIGARRRRVA